MNNRVSVVGLVVMRMETDACYRSRYRVGRRVHGNSEFGRQEMGMEMGCIACLALLKV